MKTLNILKKAIISFLIFFLSYVVPKDKSLIVLGASVGKKFNGNTKYLFLELSKNKKYVKYKPVWLSSNKNIVEKLKSKKLNAELIGTLKANFMILVANWIIIDNTPGDVFIWPFLFGKFKVVNTWHGVPIKRIGKDSPKTKEKVSLVRKFYNSLNKLFGFNSKHHEIMIANSHNDLKNMTSAFSPRKIFLTGYPRNDIIFNRKFYEFEHEDKRLELNKYKKVFLYAPTFRPYREVLPSFSDKFLKELNEYFKKKNFLLLVSSHLSTSKIEINEFERIKYLSDFQDTQELLINIDVLISDYSGSIVDFSLRGKPIFLYCYDLPEYSSKVGLYYDYSKLFKDFVIKNEKELLRRIKNIDKLEKDKKMAKFNQDLNKIFHEFYDGKSSQRFLDTVLA